jgi:hypothetical protein
MMVLSQYVVDALKIPYVPFTRPSCIALLPAHNSINILKNI